MRLSVQLLTGVVALACVLSLAGCQNPFDPVSKSDEIKGLTWVEINGKDLEGWDSDPELDGIVISLTYKNEFGDQLNFHDKPHDVVIEFWTQKDIGTGGNSFLTTDQLFFSKTIRFENSDDSIRIPYEAYFGQLSTVFDFSDPKQTFAGMLVVRVFPPQAEPRPELKVAMDTVAFYKRPAGESLTP